MPNRCRLTWPKIQTLTIQVWPSVEPTAPWPRMIASLAEHKLGKSLDAGEIDTTLYVWAMGRVLQWLDRMEAKDERA